MYNCTFVLVSANAGGENANWQWSNGEVVVSETQIEQWMEREFDVKVNYADYRRYCLPLSPKGKTGAQMRFKLITWPEPFRKVTFNGMAWV